MNDITKIAVYYIDKWFQFKLYPSQIQIADFFFNNKKKCTIRAVTRYGKSQVIALCAIMYAIFNDNKRVGIIAPTNEKTKIIMSYIQSALASCPQMNNIVDLDVMELSKLERLKREVSKRKITFKNGSSIQVLSPDIKGKGFGAMGSAFDLQVIDETAEIPDAVYSKIYRMLVEHKDSKIIEIGNPWHLNHFYDHHHADDWEKIHINWETAVKEGRMTLEAVEDQKRNLTDLEFEVLFNANFPENIENSLFKKEHIDLAIRPKEFTDYDQIMIGADIAAGGKDYTVIVVIGQKNNEFSFIDYKEINKQDLMLIVGEIQVLADKYKAKIIQIDAVGFGKGVIDRLKENGYKSYSYISGESANEKNRFYNRKSEDLFGLAEIMKDGRLWNLPDKSKFILDMRKETFEIRSDRLLKTIDPEDKSPDWLDSLNIAISRPRGRLISFSLQTL